MSEKFLERAVTLAETALKEGNEPFGSLLVDAEGNILYEDYNRINDVNEMYHPEIAICKWAADHLSPEDRQQTTVYTSGEHCPMCATAHALVGLGKIVYASSSEQLASWLDAMEVPAPPFNSLPITSVTRGTETEGPFEPYASQVKKLHEAYHR